MLPGQSTDDRQPILNRNWRTRRDNHHFDNGTPLGTAQVGETVAGHSRCPQSSEGSHNLTVSATDWRVIPARSPRRGRSCRYYVSGPRFSPPSWMTSPVLPATLSGQLTNDATPTRNGRGEAGATINVHLDGNPASIGTTTVNSDGTWFSRRSRRRQ